MTSCHRPRIYRSTDGCCICGAKSSSSRFTASVRYESYFERCFALSSGEQRTGDICNACVLLVKRFRKLPSGSTRCWAHVKDARSGPGLKSMSRIKSRQGGGEINGDYAASRVSDVAMAKHRSDSSGGTKLHSVGSRSAGSFYRIGNSSSMFIDSDYWTPAKTCCGFVYRGRYGEYLVDSALYHRCDSHSNRRRDSYIISKATAAESSSVDSGNDNDNEEEDDDDDDVSPASSSYLADDVDDAMTDDVYDASSSCDDFAAVKTS